MDFLKNIADVVISAKDLVVEKNRKAALANRLRAVVKCEEQCADRAYLALGRFYYHNMRTASNPVTEPHCVDIDASEKRLEQAIAHLEKIYSEGEVDSVVEKIDLEDVQELHFDEDTAVEGVVDEAVAAVAEPPITPEAAPNGENEDLPFEG